MDEMRRTLRRWHYSIYTIFCEVINKPPPQNDCFRGNPEKPKGVSIFIMFTENCWYKLDKIELFVITQYLGIRLHGFPRKRESKRLAFKYTYPNLLSRVTAQVDRLKAEDCLLGKMGIQLILKPCLERKIAPSTNVRQSSFSDPFSLTTWVVTEQIQPKICM